MNQTLSYQRNELFPTPTSAFTHRIPLIFQNGVSNMIRERTETRGNKIHAKRESKNRDACQQAFLIALLVKNGYEVAIKRLYKRGNITIQMFTISEISKNGIILFNESQINMKETVIKERKQYVDAITNDVLIDFLQKEGYEIEERKTRKVVKPNSVSMKRIGSIFSREEFFSFNKIVNSGKKFNEIIRSKISTKEGCTIPAYFPFFLLEKNDHHETSFYDSY